MYFLPKGGKLEKELKYVVRKLTHEIIEMYTTTLGNPFAMIRHKTLKKILSLKYFDDPAHN